MNILLFTISFFILMTAQGDELNPEVGFCSGPPCCSYETQACSVNDNEALITRSKIVSGSHEFCSKLMSSHWTYLPLDMEHTVPRTEAQKYLPLGDQTTRINPKAGYFDINNDGKAEYLGWIQLYSGAGSGCDVEVFVELNDQRDHIKHSVLSHLLNKHSCREFNRAFKFEGKTYIENRRRHKISGLDYSLPNLLSEVFVIEGESRRSVCTFKLK